MRSGPAVGQIRLAGLAAIDAKLDLGKGLSVQAFAELTTKLGTEITAYNSLLSTLDAKLDGIQKLEKDLGTLSTRALKRIAADYGDNSDEYEKVGGKRSSERKKSVRKVTKV